MRIRYSSQEIISLVSICVGSFLIILDTNIVNIIIPDLRSDLSLTVQETSWVINSYVLAFASLILFFARVSKRIGAKNAFLAGITIFMIGSFFCGISSTYEELLLSRILQGVGAALFAPIATTLLSSTVIEPRKRALSFGIWSGTSGLGFAFSPILGGFLNELWGWQSIFLINIPFTGLVIVTALIAIKENRRIKVPMILKEQLIVFTLIILFVYYTHEYKLVQREELIFFIGISLFLTLGFRYILKFKKNSTFLLPKEMFTKLNVVSLANGFTYNFSIYGIMFFLSIYFQENLHLSSLDTGIKFLPLTITGMLLSLFLSPVLVNKFGQAITQQMCLFAIVAGSALLFFYFLVTPILYLIPVSFFFLGFSGSIAPVLTSVAFVATKEEYQKEISSILNLIRQLGSIVGVTAVSILLNLTGKEAAILYYLSFTTLIAFASYMHMIRAQKREVQLSDKVK